MDNNSSTTKKLILCAVMLSLIFLASPYFIARVLEPKDSNTITTEPPLITPITPHRGERPRSPAGHEPVEHECETTVTTNLCPFERYIIGVVAAEVPALFHMEALRAQAVAARTYAIYSMSTLGMDQFDYARISEIWQAYLSEPDMRLRWGNNFDTHFATIHEAVRSTKGEILVYNNEPILAVFHAQSGGQTEYSENVWHSPRPYLQSVNSDFYTYRPDFEYRHKFTQAELNTRLNSALPNMLPSNNVPQIQINSRSAAGYVQSVTIAGQSLDAAALRTALNLRSTNFTIHHENTNTIFTARGHGHGVGMSQIGANALAQRGYSYVEILEHYYRGARVVFGIDN